MAGHCDPVQIVHAYPDEDDLTPCCRVPMRTAAFTGRFTHDSATVTCPPPLARLADDMVSSDGPGQLAIVLMKEWARVEPRSSPSQHPSSYVASFVDLARAALASRRTISAEAFEVAVAVSFDTNNQLVRWAEMSRHDPVTADLHRDAMRAALASLGIVALDA